MGLLQNIYKLAFQQETPRPRPDGEIGKTGTEIFSGIISGEEYLSTLQGRQGLKKYDEMRRSDATVAAVLLAIKLPILGSVAKIKPASDTDEDKKVADFVKAALFEKMEMSWQEFLRQALMHLEFGHMVFEKVFQIIDVDGKEYIGWKKFSPRLPKSIQRWEIAGGKPGITQIVQGEHFEIPMEKLMVFTNNKEGENYEGISVLRSAYKHWYYKNNYYVIDSLSFEKQGVGIPVFKLPAGHDTTDKRLASNIAKNLRANESLHVIMPAGWEFEFADMKGNSTRDPEKAILHHDRQITKSVLTQFLELGAQGGSGSRALSEDHSDLFYMGERAVAQQIADVINKQAIKELVDMNFDVTYYPKLEFVKIGRIDFEKIANAVGTLVEKGVIIPDQMMENYLRDQMDLPEPTDEAKKVREFKLEQAATPLPEKDTPPLDKKPAGEDSKGLDKPNLENEADKREQGRGEVKKTIGEGKKKASEPKPAFVPWRPLTMAEQKVDWKLVQDRLTEMEKNLVADTKRILEQASPVLLEELRRNLKNKDIEAIKDMAIAYKGPYRKEVLRNLLAAYEFGKRGASKEMKIDFPSTPEGDQLRLEMLADTIADATESDILKGMKVTVLAALGQKKTFDQAINMVAIELGKLTDRLTYNTAVATVGGAYNDGRLTSFLSNDDSIHALQRSEILDGRVCNFCLSMDGRIVSTKDPIAKATIFHSNCRGIWVAVMKDEAELPEIKGVPDSLKNRWKGGVNDFEQLDAPITDPGTIADQFANRFSEVCTSDCGHHHAVIE